MRLEMIEMSSGRFNEDGLGFSFEVKHHRKQYKFNVTYVKEFKKVCITSETREYPLESIGTSVSSYQRIMIEPERAMILFNDKFWSHVPEIMKNIDNEYQKEAK
jgi:hypothetical protein